MGILKAFLLTTVVFFGIDIFWISLVAKKMYETHLGELMGNTKVLPAIIFYFMYIGGIIFFVLIPASEKQSLLYAITAGAFLGLIGYGTFALTNLAVLKDYPVILSVADLLWGAFLTGATGGITYQLIKILGWKL